MVRIEYFVCVHMQSHFSYSNRSCIRKETKSCSEKHLGVSCCYY